MRARPLARFIWNSFSPITETVDFINVLYECLPFQVKQNEYFKRGPQWNKDRNRWRERTTADGVNHIRVKRGGRQPNPKEKMEILYRNINKLDVGCAMRGYIEEQITDMMYSIGGKQMAKANRQLNRPIGFEAGGGLNGFRPFIQVL